MPPLFTVSGEHSWRVAGIPEFDWDLVNSDGAGTLRGRSCGCRAGGWSAARR